MYVSYIVPPLSNKYAQYLCVQIHSSSLEYYSATKCVCVLIDQVSMQKEEKILVDICLLCTKGCKHHHSAQQAQDYLNLWPLKDL